MSFDVRQLSSGVTQLKAKGDSVLGGIVEVEFAPGVNFIIGRGTADTDRTYFAMRNSSGVLYYNYVDTTTLVTTTTAP